MICGRKEKRSLEGLAAMQLPELSTQPAALTWHRQRPGQAPRLLSRFTPCPPFCVEEVTNEPRNKNAGGLIQPRSHKEAAEKV